MTFLVSKTESNTEIHPEINTSIVILDSVFKKNDSLLIIQVTTNILRESCHVEMKNLIIIILAVPMHMTCKYQPATAQKRPKKYPMLSLTKTSGTHK